MIIKQSNSSKDKLGYSCGTNYAIQHLSYNEDTHQLILKQNPDIVFYIDLNLLKDKDRILHLNPVEDIIETTPSTPNDNVNYVVHDLESGKYEYYNYNVKLHNWNTFTLITGCEFYNKADNTKYLYDGINLIDITHVNLSAVAEQDKIIVNNDKGTGFELLLATNTEAGLISPEEKSIINIISNEGFVSTASIQDVSNKLSLAIKTYNPITKDYTVSTYGLREFELGKNGLVPAPEEARDDVFLNAKGKWVKLEFGELANTVVNAIAAETVRAKAEEAKLKLAISEETKRATKAEESIKTLVSTNSGELAILKEAYKEADIEVLKTLRDEIKVISDTKVNIEQGKELMPSPNVDEDLKNSYFLSADGAWKKIETDDYVFVLEANIPETITSETAVSLLNPNEAERYLKYYLEYIQNTNITKPSLFLKDINGNYPSVLLAPIGLDINTNKYIGISYYKETLYKPIVTFDYNVSKKNIQIFNVALKIDLVKIATHDYVENATNKLRDIITTLLQNKVDKEEGKTLTTNDFTDAYKGVIDRIEEYINNIEIIAPSDSEALVLASNKYSPITDSTVTVEQLFPNVTDTHSGLMTPSYKRALDNFVIDNTEMNIYGTPANRWQIDTTIDGPVFINRVGYVDFKAGLEKESYANLVLNDINIKGVVKHEGTSFISNAQIIKFGDNTIEINSNETGEGVSDILAGIEIYRGTLPKYNIYYDDADKILKSGETNGLYPILNTDYLVDLTDTMFLGWDKVTKRAKTTNKTGHAIYAPAFFRSPDNSETLYQADIVNDLTTGGIDKVLSAEVGKEIFKAIEEGTKYNSMFDDPEMPTTKTVGGITAGTKLSKLQGKTFSQLFDNALFTEMQPSVTAPSASLRLSFTTLLEVGAPAPVKSNFTTGYSRGSATVAGQTNRYRAGILRPDESFIYYGGNANNKDMYPEKVILGSMSWNYRAYYEQGDELVTSWGNTANINPNPLPAGYVTSSAVSISGTYPFFANGQSCSSSSQDTNLPSTAGNMVKMALMSWGTTLVGIKFASEAATNVRLAFQFPQAKTVTKVEFFNTVSGKWEVFGSTNWNIRDIEDKTVQGNPVKYSELTTTGALSGALQLRFTIANSGRPINDTTLREALNDFDFLDVNHDITNISDTGNRAEGVAKFAVNFEPGGQTPLDARTLVTTRADLINPNTYYAKNYYQGLYAITKDTQELWVLKDVTKITSPDYSGWKRLDVGAVPIVDNLNSTSTTSALSANQGKVLNEKIESLSSDVDSNYLKLTGGTLTGVVNFNAGLNVNNGNTVVQNITIKGNVTQEGESFITKAETVNITDNILILNNGEKGSGVTKGTSGIEVDRGSADNFLFVFDEADDRFKAGYANSLQPIMLRDAESSLVANKFLYWDATNKISKTREIVINDISNIHTTWQSFLGSGIYTRNIGINGNQWTFISNINATTTSIYAPITSGSAGQYLKSSGGVPVWNTLTMSDISDSANILNEYLPLSAGSSKPLTGMLYATKGILVPSDTGIKMWREHSYTWVEYMRAASEASPTGGTLGTYGNVTSYARRSLIENISGYGWIWESCANEVNVATNPMMALSSVNGNLYVKGDITAPTFRGDVVGNATTSNSFQNPFTFTIGLKSKNVKGDAPISYSLAEIGALPLTGGSMTANARISFPNTNLYIGNSDNSGWVYLQDVASQSGATYWYINNTGTALFKESVTSSKFVKSGSSDNYVLLGGGGHRALSDFATSGHKHDYLPLSGGTLTGRLNANYGVNILEATPSARFNKNLSIVDKSGYARNILTFSLNGNPLAQIGVCGQWNPSIPNIEDCIDYIYMSPTETEYNGANFKIHKNKVSFNNYTILHSYNVKDYALPITGGTVTGPIYLNSNLVLPSHSQGDYSVCLKTATGSLITGLYFPTDDSVKYGNANFNKVTIASKSGVSLTHLNGNTEYTIYDSGNFPGSITSEANKYVMRDNNGFIQGENINTSLFKPISCKEHWVRIAKVRWGIFHLYGFYNVGGMTSLVFSISTSYRNKDGSCLTLLSGNKLSTVTKLRLTLDEETLVQYLELKYSYIEEGKYNFHRLYASLGGCEHINPWEEVPEELPTGWRVLDVLDVNHDGVATTGAIKTKKTIEATGLLKTQSGVQLGSIADIGIYHAMGNRISAGIEVAQGFNAGSLLVSSAWDDYPKVPTHGIYAKGVIHSDSGYYVQGNRIENLNIARNNSMITRWDSFSSNTKNSPGDDTNSSISCNDGFVNTLFWDSDYGAQIAYDIDGTGIAYRGYTPSTGVNKTGWKFLANTSWVKSQISSGTVAAANKLTTGRAINGTNFDGTTAITTSLWGTERTLTIGLTGKLVNGSQNVAWTLSEIGALALTGGTVTGLTKFNNGVQIGTVDDIGWYYSSIVSSRPAIVAGISLARNVNAGSLLVSSSWGDGSSVPENGIYSKGLIHAHSGIISESVIGAMEGVSVLPANNYNLNSDFQVTNSYMVINANSGSQGAPSTSGDHAVININGSSGNYGVQIAVNWNSPQMYFRSINPANGNSHYTWTNIASTTYVDNAVNKLNYAASNTPGGSALTVLDSGDNSSTIKLAYRGNGLTASSALHLAAFSKTLNNGSRVIRDISAYEALKFIGAAPSNHVHTTIKGLYEYEHGDNYGGVKAPSYFTGGTSRFNLMYKNIAGVGGGFCDWLVMDNYTGADVPYVTGIGVLKANIPEAFIISGPKGSEDKSTWVRRKLATVEDDLTWNNIQGKPSSFTPNNVIFNDYKATYDLNTTPNRTIYIGEVHNATNSPTNYTIGDIFSFWGDDEGLQLWASSDKQSLFYRIRWNSNIGPWKQLVNTSGINMEADARISASSGNLYIGNSDDSGYVYMQAMCSYAGLNYWKINTHGYAFFKETVSARGFVKSGSNDNYVLLGGGGHKALSELTVTLDKSKILAALNQPGTNTFTTYCDFTAGAGNSGSDMRFKTNISPINNILSDLMKIKIFTYTWNKLGERQLDTLGVSANDLEDNSLFTKLVHERPDEDKTKFVDYDRIGVLALKGVQELAEENNKIKEENIKLKRALKALILELDIDLDI